jgi:hypothetical protein
MAKQPTVFRGPDTEEAFFADKLRFWDGLGKGIIAAVTVVVLILIGLAVFL